MTTTTPPANPLLALAYLLSAIFAFETVGLCVKLTEGDISLYTIVFARSFFAILPLALAITLMRGWGKIRTTQPKLHIVRGVIGFATMLANFYAIKELDLATVTAIQFTMPFFMMILAAVWLKEQLTPIRLAAVVVGFGGALLVLHPEDGAGISLAGLAALASAFLGGTASVIIRRLTKTDSSLTVALSYACFASLFALPLLPFGFTIPSLHDGLLLMAAGTAGGCAQLLLTQAYRHAPVSVIAPYEYSALLWAMSFNFIFWDKLPTVMMLTGAAIIVAADLMVLWQEERQRKTCPN